MRPIPLLLLPLIWTLDTAVHVRLRIASSYIPCKCPSASHLIRVAAGARLNASARTNGLPVTSGPTIAGSRAVEGDLRINSSLAQRRHLLTRGARRRTLPPLQQRNR